MTFVDTATLAERTCPVCGAVVGDMLRHRRWHAEEEAITDATLEALRPLARDLERRAAEE